MHPKIWGFAPQLISSLRSHRGFNFALSCSVRSCSCLRLLLGEVLQTRFSCRKSACCFCGGEISNGNGLCYLMMQVRCVAVEWGRCSHAARPGKLGGKGPGHPASCIPLLLRDAAGMLRASWLPGMARFEGKDYACFWWAARRRSGEVLER